MNWKIPKNKSRQKNYTFNPYTNSINRIKTTTQIQRKNILIKDEKKKIKTQTTIVKTLKKKNSRINENKKRQGMKSLDKKLYKYKRTKYTSNLIIRYK